ncbi:MAG: Mov34/MPN/PAD-1 family protein [Actinomycetota bacterium]
MAFASKLTVPETELRAMHEHALAGYPYEACGLLVGHPDRAEVVRFVPCTNAANSARVYTIDPKEHLRAELAAEADGLEIIGVMHSHTHSEAYPSPTDVAQAPDPGWHYLIVTLVRDVPEARSFRIDQAAVEGSQITEEDISTVYWLA